MRKVILGSTATLALAALAFAHHIPVALSYVAGAEILTNVDLRLSGESIGVPPYVVSNGELETVSIADGAQFSVVNGEGTTETVTFDAADFADMSAIPVEDVVAHVNSQLSVAMAEVDNSYFTLRGLGGGVASTLGLQDGVSNPLASLNLGETTVAGALNAHMAISVPGEDHHHGEHDHQSDYAGFQYLLVASATQGEFVLPNGMSLPLALDAWTVEFLNATDAGMLPGFHGVLNETGDAEAILPTLLLPSGSMPEKLYFAYLVVDPTAGIVFTSNRFTINVID